MPINILSQNGQMVRKPTLTAAFTDADTAGKTVVITGPVTAGTLDTDGRSLEIKQGGVITIPTGVTLTINAPFTAGLYQVFDGDGSIVFGSGSVAEVYPEWWGAKGDGVTNDCDAINSAFASIDRGIVKLTAGSEYSIENTLVFGDNITLDSTGAKIRSHHAGAAISVGSTFTWIGNDSELYNDIDITDALFTTTAKDSIANIKILGWPYIYNSATARNTGSVGIDGEVFYDSRIQAQVRYFDVGIKIGGGSMPAYYNEIDQPRLYGNEKGIYAVKGTSFTNSLSIITPSISGGGDTGGKYGIHIDGANQVQIRGGYLEAFNASSTDTKGIWLKDAGRVVVDGVALDSNSSVSNYAIYTEGTTHKASFLNVMCASGWASAAKTLSWNASGYYDWIGHDYATNSSFIIMNSNTSLAATFIGTSATGYPGAGYIKGSLVLAPQFRVIGTTIGGLTRKSVESTVSITASTSVTLTLNIPAGARLLGAWMRVDTALNALDRWDAAYSGGSTASIDSNVSYAANSRVRTLFNSYTSSPITTATTNIAITRQGGGSFQPEGVIRGTVIYEIAEIATSL